MPEHARRPARPHEPGRQPPPPHMTEKENAAGMSVIRKSPRPHQAGGRGRPPAGKGAHTAPLQTPAGPRRRTPPRRRARQAGRRRNGRSPIRRRSRAAGMSAPGMQGPPKGPSSHPVRVHAADTARFPRTEPAPRGGPAHSFSFRPVGFASGSYRRRGTRQRATQRAAPGAIANDGTRFGR